MKRVNTCINVRRKRFGDVTFFPFLIQTCWKVSTAFNLITPPSSWLVSFFVLLIFFVEKKNRIYWQKTSLPYLFFPQKIEFTSKQFDSFHSPPLFPFPLSLKFFWGETLEDNWTNEFESKEWVKTFWNGLTCWETSNVI